MLVSPVGEALRRAALETGEAKRLRIGEEDDDIFERSTGAVRRWSANHQVLLAGQARFQRHSAR